jgi:hypothetical protein
MADPAITRRKSAAGGGSYQDRFMPALGPVPTRQKKDKRKPRLIRPGLVVLIAVRLHLFTGGAADGAGRQLLDVPLSFSTTDPAPSTGAGFVAVKASAKPGRNSHQSPPSVYQDREPPALGPVRPVKNKTKNPG